VFDDVPVRKANTRKRVQWVGDRDMEQIKYFKMNDEPKAPGLSMKEVELIREHLASVPAHFISKELKDIEMQMDKEKLREHKHIEEKIKVKLHEMHPLIRPVLRGKDLKSMSGLKLEEGVFKLGAGEKSTEESAQRQRERTVFQAYYRIDS